MFPGWNFPGSNFYNILRFEVELKIQDLLKLMIFQGLYGILERYLLFIYCDDQTKDFKTFFRFSTDVH